MFRHDACFRMGANYFKLWPVKYMALTEMKKFQQALLIAFLFLPGAVMSADEIVQRAALLSKGGASQLAIWLLEQSQPSLEAGSSVDQWVAWEKQRLAIYSEQQNWLAISRRTEELPHNLPEGFTQWALFEGANAGFRANNPTLARAHLRRLVLQFAGAEKQVMAQWRQLIIRSYLLEGNAQDAEIALQKYKQDFGDDNEDARILEVRLLMRNGDMNAAFEVSVGAQSYEGQMLRLLAGLRQRIYSPEQAMGWALQLGAKIKDQPVLSRQIWSVAAEAAHLAGDWANYVFALEKYLSIEDSMPVDSPMEVASGSDLWKAYERTAERVGNDRRLLIGDDQKWLKAAQAQNTDQIHLARAIYAFLIHLGQEPETKRIAHQRLVGLLHQQEYDTVVRHLYIGASRYPSVQTIPDEARAVIAMEAVKHRDIEFASTLINGLEMAPTGEDQTQWRLQQAGILIYAGKSTLGAAKLRLVLSESKKIDDELARKFIGVVFDLQALQQHQPALELFRALFDQVKSNQIKRELYFWMADSEMSLGNFNQAANLYLQSAGFDDTEINDPWGQAARFYAAKAMIKAGLKDDARNTYERLLEVTSDPRQRIIIERSIQQLWLNQKRDS
ncbi:MAG: hypothetical protein OEY67_03810 [Gammaproteobacteria bacterium]|nr:hypothetical protein [Gammaproteobacteria bacterium]